MKTKLHKIKRFIAKHPAISMFIVWFAISLVDSIKTGEVRYSVGAIWMLVIFAFLAPFIRAERRKIEMDYLAKKIAEESNTAAK